MKYIKDFLQDIANAIKEKTNKTNNIKTEDFVQEIDSIVSDNGQLKKQSKVVQLTSADVTTITPDVGYDGMDNVSITPILQTKTTELTSSSAITISSDEGKVGMSSVAITPKLQSKSVTVTSNTTTTITPDSGYAGLSQVSVISNVGSSNLTYKVMWCQGVAEPSSSITIPAATTRAYLIINASTQNNFQGCSVSGTGLTISRVNSDELGAPYTAVNGGFRYSTFVYLITKSAGTARTLSVSWKGYEMRYSCPVLIY